MLLQHYCNNCKMVHYGDKITMKFEKVAQSNDGKFDQRRFFKCPQCDKKFDEVDNPLQLRVRVGELKKVKDTAENKPAVTQQMTEKVLFLHPLPLRHDLESMFQVDENYRSLRQMNVSKIRQ